MRWRFNKSDRVVLAALIVLLVSYAIYAGITSKGVPSAAEEQASAPDTVPAKVAQADTVPLAQQVEQKKAKKVPMAPVRTARYPGPPEAPRRSEGYLPKLKPGATIDLNSADTTLLKRVPGIGSSFARRIVKYRDLLGGYYVVEQLQEVYGMDRERYSTIYPYFVIRTEVRPLTIAIDTISRHPYLQWRHKSALRRLLEEEQELTWPLLMSTGSFSRDDSLRLAPYMPF